MICKNCGTEFIEGIFCPECGVRIETEDVGDLQKNVDQEEFKDSKKSEILIAKEKAEVEKARMELEARTYNGVVYNSELEARCAREENNKIDILKQKLEAIKDQSERQHVMADFKDEITTVEAKKRLAMLRQKVSQPVPKAEKNNKYVGIISGVMFIISLVMAAIVPSESMILMTVASLLMLAGLAGIIVWFVRKILNIVKSKTRNYYLYIKDI